MIHNIHLALLGYLHTAVLRMFKWPRLEVTSISRRDFALVFMLLFNAFTWSYMIFLSMRTTVESTMSSALTTVFYLAAAGAGLAGSLLTEKVRRVRFLYFWMILGLLSSFTLIFVYSLAVAQLSLIYIALGISFGLGMPSSLAYLADHTMTENRGTVSALIFLAANLSVLPLGVLFTKLDLMSILAILAAWRALGLVAFATLKPKEAALENEQKRIPLTSVFSDRHFSLYLLPWVMFLLVDVFEKGLLQDFVKPEILSLMLIVEPVASVFFSMLAGLFMDKIGRKRMVIYGFVTLGLGYAMVGLAPTESLAWYIYMVVDGAAWGILLTIFLLTLWGDLSQPKSREKYYAVGIFPFLARNVIPFAFVTVISTIPASAAFSLASFFLFLAVLPLMYAPETLPEKKMELRRLKDYVERAKRLAGKQEASEHKSK